MAKVEVVNIAAANTRLPELVERASNSEEIILARNGKPKARLVAIGRKKKFVRGAGKGNPFASRPRRGLRTPADIVRTHPGPSEL